MLKNAQSRSKNVRLPPNKSPRHPRNQFFYQNSPKKPPQNRHKRCKKDHFRRAGPGAEVRQEALIQVDAVRNANQNEPRKGARRELKKSVAGGMKLAPFDAKNNLESIGRW
jgi:hypothetical protein